MPFPSKHVRFLSYSKEITLALLVKFLLLSGLWWLFFSGNKPPVDGAIIAEKIFGESHPAVISQKNKESR
ncbi:cytochrome oxidase putative small subunit CydP [Crenothrix polyspora]|uniref:cytochrome oxidase putative small subunit CydP n=1 Tax=Crenothrix polyspora TaxID=360316 RepID=UPI000B36424B|nr:cytochrome oxidase putative small subunit CydP [Crenothrix polyspora]